MGITKISAEVKNSAYKFRANLKKMARKSHEIL